MNYLVVEYEVMKADKKRRSKRHRMLVTGDRNWDNQQVVDDVLDRYSATIPKKRPHIIEGGAKGADAQAADWANRRGAKHTRVKADWAKHHRAAGPIRNKKMLDMKPGVVIGFHDDIDSSKGTKNMLAQARKSKRRTRVELWNSQGWQVE